MEGEDRRVEDERQSVEELYERAPCGYLTVAANGQIIKLNHTLLEWLGYERAELLGKRFVELLTPAGRIFHETHYRPLLHMQGFVEELAFDLVAKDGRRLPVLVQAKQRNTAAQGTVEAAGETQVSIFNVSQRRAYERELLYERQKAEQQARAKADFLASASHEIRNYLHSITAVTELLGRQGRGAKHERFLGLLQSSSTNLLNLVNDILDFSKLEAGKLKLEEREFKLGELLDDVQATLRARAELKGLVLRVWLDERVPPSLLGDPGKIAQVLVNLAGNAIKFTERGGITIAAQLKELSPRAACVRFSVSDTGLGIPPDQVSAIFEEYAQGNLSPAARLGGTGLGLAICRRILQLYGSVVEVESAVGTGSVFSFDLRLAYAPSATQGAQQGPGLHGLKVLVAEDAELEAQAIARLLERWGAEYDVVGNGRDAVEHVQRRDYDVVLMDLQLPELDGCRATQAIRTLRQGAAPLPIIALSGSAEINQRALLAGAGFTDILDKPFESEALFRSISTHGALHRSLRTGQANGLALAPH